MAENFGERLRRLRERAGLRQGKLAEIARAPQSLISMLERGVRDGDSVKGITLLLMAQALGVSVEYLLTGKRPTSRRRHEFDDGDALAGEIEVADAVLV